MKKIDKNEICNMDRWTAELLILDKINEMIDKINLLEALLCPYEVREIEESNDLHHRNSLG